MMRCLLGCFRVASAEGGGRKVKGHGDGDGQLVAPSLAQMANHEVGAGRRARPPSRNALSAVFLREDEGSIVELTASSWADQSGDRKRDEDPKHEDIMQESCDASLKTTIEPQRVLEDAGLVHQMECGPPVFDNVHFMEALDVEDRKTPSRFHQSPTVADAMSSSKANEEVRGPATSDAADFERLTKENNTETSTEIKHHVLDPAKDYEKCGISRLGEDFIQFDRQTEYRNSVKNDNLVSMQISISEECSFHQSSENSISSLNKVNDSINTTCTEATSHATRKKVLKNTDLELEFPSLSEWLKPPNPRKPFRDEALKGDRSVKSSDEDRPIIGMVAAHWKDEEPEKFTPKWWDGNGIPNSTNKYKEDQKVSWHAMSFEERLEKALSEEKSLSERNCFSGKTSHILGMEGEESDTAESSHLYAAAHA